VASPLVIRTLPLVFHQLPLIPEDGEPEGASREPEGRTGERGGGTLPLIPGSKIPEGGGGEREGKGGGRLRGLAFRSALRVSARLARIAGKYCRPQIMTTHYASWGQQESGVRKAEALTHS
jgi:hypothetical protein